MLLPPPLRNVEKSEEEVWSFKSRRPSQYLQTSVLTMNLNEMKQERYHCSDIYTRLRLDLFRKKDQNRRMELAESVANNMAVQLMKDFPGTQNSSKLVLFVNLTVVSDGCSTFEEHVPSFQGKGMAKIAVVYCLYRQDTGDVILSRQLSETEQNLNEDERPAVSEDSKKRLPLLQSLQEKINHEINKEITFVCCSRVPTWMEIAREMLTSEMEEDNRASSMKSAKPFYRLTMSRSRVRNNAEMEESKASSTKNAKPLQSLTKSRQNMSLSRKIHIHMLRQQQYVQQQQQQKQGSDARRSTMRTIISND